MVIYTQHKCTIEVENPDGILIPKENPLLNSIQSIGHRLSLVI